MPKEPTQVIYVRLRRSIVKALKDRADQQRRTMAAQIELILSDWIEAASMDKRPTNDMHAVR